MKKVKTIRMTNPLEVTAQYPDIAHVGNRVFIAYQLCENNQDIIMVGEYKGTDETEWIKLSRGGQAFKPRLFSSGSKLYIAWSEARDKKWALCLSEYEKETWSEPVELASANCISDVELAACDDRLWIFWSQTDTRRHAVAMRMDCPSSMIEVGDETESYRPRPALGGDGRLYVLYDFFNGCDYQLRVALWNETNFTSSPVETEEGWPCACSLAPAENGVLALWYTIGRNSTVRYMSCEVFNEGEKPVCRNISVDMESNFWCLYMAQSGDGSVAAFNVSRGIIARKRINNCWGPAFVVTPNVLTKYSRRPRITVLENGDIYTVYQNAQGNGHTWTRHSHIVLSVIKKNAFDGGCDAGLIIKKEEFNNPVPLGKTIMRTDPQELAEFEKTSLPSYEGVGYFWGDIHGQSCMSDGIGTIDQYYNFNKSKALMDFTALSDHDAFPDVLSPSDWALIQSTCNAFNRDESYAVLLGYEWTSNEFRYDYGHKNVYYRGEEGPFYPCISQEGYSPDRLYKALENKDCLVIPHHMGAVWSVVLASTDWEYHNEKLQTVSEVLSRHAIFEHDDDDSPYTKNVSREEGNCIINVLKKGYRLGFIGGSDSHQMEAGIEGGVTCALAKSLTRENVFDAIHGRRAYATTGARILAQFEINGYASGSEIKVKQGGKLTIKGHILGENKIKSIRIVTDTGILQEWKVPERKFDFEITMPASKSNWYYLRIEQEDRHLALISPIWVEVERINWTPNRLPKNETKEARDALALTDVVEIEKARAFHKSIPVYKETPLQVLNALAKKLGLGGVYVKDESYRFGLNSFKALGGSYAIARYVAERLGKDVSEMTWNDFTSDETREKIGQLTFFTATDGNHGRGVAWAARQLGQKCVVYMPKGTSLARLENIRKEGAKVEITGFNYDDTIRMTAEEANQTSGSVIVQDTSWEGYEKIPAWIMQGYGVMALEADERLGELEQKPTHVFVQAGVGSMAAAVQGYFANRYRENPPKMVVVEASAADCFYRSAVAGDGAPRIVSGDMDTIMAGLACGEPYPIAWEIFKNNSAGFTSCPDWVTKLGMCTLAAPLPGDPAVTSGESGAVTTGLLAAIMQIDEMAECRTALGLNEQSRVLLFSTEGDTDPVRYRQIVEG